jgi:hypothetical protein
VELAFDLSALSEPKPSEHTINVAITVVCGVSAWLVWRTVQRTKASYGRIGYLLRLYIPVFLLLLGVTTMIGECRLIAGAEQRLYASWIDHKEYQIESGQIRNLALKDKFWKTDPLPTFVVGSTVFEYGVFSKNHRLLNHLDGGPLREGRHVTIWHHDGLVLRMYVTD